MVILVKTVRKWMVSLLSAALCLSLLAAPAGAYGRVDTARDCSLTLTYVDTDRKFPMKGMELRLYKVADMSDAVRFDVSGTDFKDTPIQMEDYSLTLGHEVIQKNWSTLTTTLAGLVTSDRAELAKDETYVLKYTPVATVTVDETGTAAFTGLKAGLYLLMGDQLKDGRYTYTPQTTLLTLPTLTTTTEKDDDGSDKTTVEKWEYAVSAGGKWTRSHESSGGGKASLSVVKVWEEDGSQSRPSSVAVRLMKNGAIYEEVTLSAAGGWKHTWNNLDKNAEWTLAEVDVPEGYTVTVEQSGSTFVVTNTGDVDIPEEPTPEGPVDPDGGDDDVDIPDEEIPQGGLPQTGLPWWPVQALTAVGLVLFLLGWADMRRSRKYEK